MILTIEVEYRKRRIKSEDIGEVAICCDEEGLDLLIKRLTQLRGTIDHTHLMTPSWAGAELTEEKLGGKEYILINHLRIVKT